jgi:hypothetical protein
VYAGLGLLSWFLLCWLASGFCRNKGLLDLVWMKGFRLLALCFDYVLVRCRRRYTEEVVKCDILALRCLYFISKPENFMVCSWSARLAWGEGRAITFFGPRGHEYHEGAEQHHSQQQQPHLACFLSAALTSDVRREFFVAVDAAQNVAQSRVRGPTNSPRVNCTLRPFTSQ